MKLNNFWYKLMASALAIIMVAELSARGGGGGHGGGGHGGGGRGGGGRGGRGGGSHAGARSRSSSRSGSHAGSHSGNRGGRGRGAYGRGGYGHRGWGGYGYGGWGWGWGGYYGFWLGAPLAVGIGLSTYVDNGDYNGAYQAINDKLDDIQAQLSAAKNQGDQDSVADLQAQIDELHSYVEQLQRKQTGNEQNPEEPRSIGY